MIYPLITEKKKSLTLFLLKIVGVSNKVSLATAEYSGGADVKKIIERKANIIYGFLNLKSLL